MYLYIYEGVRILSKLCSRNKLLDGAISFVSDLFTRDRHKQQQQQQQQQQQTSHTCDAQQDSSAQHSNPVVQPTRVTRHASRDTEEEAQYRDQGGSSLRSEWPLEASRVTCRASREGGSSLDLPLDWAQWQASALIEPS